MKKVHPVHSRRFILRRLPGPPHPDSAADATVADFSIPEANAKPDPAGEGSDAGDWIYGTAAANGGALRGQDTTFLFVEEYPIGSDTNHYRVFIRRAPQPADNVNFTVLSPQNERTGTNSPPYFAGSKKPSGAASASCRTGRTAASWTPVRSFGEALLRRWPPPIRCGFPIRCSSGNSWTAPVRHRSKQPGASPPRIIVSGHRPVFGYRPGGDTHRGYRTQDSRICFLLRKQ